ncbi:hypothetical protein ABZV77_23655 [Streptomyces sp. NPDC004732]|uniref:hypothetical protein n=1 Tax=Streptomyces sp. NPDC004732 TaxID=3154290 RepID=UPI0033A6CD17
MSDDLSERILVRATKAPWRAILSHRWSATRQRAMVLKDGEGRYFLLGRGGDPEEFGAAAPVPEEAPRPRLWGTYVAVFHVDLTEHVDTRAVGLPTVYGTESVDLRVSWWVHDPVRVVRSRTTYGWETVRTHLNSALHFLTEAQDVAGTGLGAPEVMHHLSAPQRLEEAGLSYRVFDVRLRETGEELLLARTEGDAVKYSWTADRRGEYEFCLQALRNGPMSLAALWLLRHPDQVSQVLDWAVSHQSLLEPPRTDWQDELAALLGTLTEQEKKEISQLLRDRIGALGRPVPGARAI